MNHEVMKFAHGVLTGLLAALVAFGSPAFAAGGKLIIADAFPPTAGWAMETDDSFTLTKAGCLEGLVRLDFDGALVPALSTGWEQVSPTEWDVTVREGVKFQNGEPLDAAAVAGALNHVLSADAPARAFLPQGRRVRRRDRGHDSAHHHAGSQRPAASPAGRAQHRNSRPGGVRG